MESFTQHLHIVLSSRVSQPNSLSLSSQNNLLIPRGNRVIILCTAPNPSLSFLKCGDNSCTQYCRCGLNKIQYNCSKTPFFISSNPRKTIMPFAFLIASMNNLDCAPNSLQHFKIRHISTSLQLWRRVRQTRSIHSVSFSRDTARPAEVSSIFWFYFRFRLCAILTSFSTHICYYL